MFTEENLKELGVSLPVDEINKLSDFANTRLNEEKGIILKDANSKNEQFLDNVFASTRDRFGVSFEDRPKGVKFGEHLQAFTDKLFAEKEEQIKEKEKELEEKIKNNSGSKLLESEYQNLKEERNKLEAELLDRKDYETILEERNSLLNDKNKRETEDSYNLVKPVVANKEDEDLFNIAWKDFKQKTSDKYNIQGRSEDGKDVMLTDKENDHIKVRLSELIRRESIFDRFAKAKESFNSPNGSESKQVSALGTEITLEIPEGANKQEKEKIIQNEARRIASKKNNGKSLGREYSKYFDEALKEIREALAA